MANDNIKELVRLEYENGMTMVYLSGKYNVSVGTIKTWSFKNKWIKKKPNIKTKTKTKTNKKPKPVKNQKTNQDIQIKQDILNEVPKEEIMQKHSIVERTYYNKKKSVRELITNRNKMILESIADKLIPDKESRLIKYKVVKLELLKQIEEAIFSDDIEDLKPLNDKLNLLTKAEKELYKELRIKVTYEETAFEKELVEEQLQRDKLEIEKLKAKDIINNSTNELVSIIDDITEDK